MSEPERDDRLLTVREAGEMLGWTMARVRAAIKRGELRCHLHAGGRYYVLTSAVRDLGGA